MRLQSVTKGDIVRCDVGGRQFYASVRLKLKAGLLAVTPIEPNVSFTRVTAHQVIGHWRRTQATAQREAELAREPWREREAVAR